MTVCNSWETRKRVAKETTPPKKRDQEEWKGGYVFMEPQLSPFPNCSVLLSSFYALPGTRLCSPKRKESHCAPPHTALTWSNFCSQKVFLMIFYLVDIHMFLRYQAEFHSLASDPLPKHPLSHEIRSLWHSHTFVTTGWGVGQRVVIIPLRVFSPFRLYVSRPIPCNFF